MLNQEEVFTFLKKEKSKKYFLNICEKIEKEYEKGTIFPDYKDIFKAFEITNFNDLKVIILGQDPYHAEGFADGLAFSSKSKRIPASLNNLYKEIKNSYPDFQSENGNLERWSKQGVLLLNTILTVEKGKPLSHKHIGWETFTFNFLNFISNKQKNLIFLFMGKKAEEFIPLINLEDQIILTTSHPSPFSYAKSLKNSQIFKKINDMLINLHKNSIKW
ncbi:uracil-DNA glycosylase [Mycoplasma sp. 1012]